MSAMTSPKSVRCVIVIPACFASRRLPGKPLLDILGKPMIQHVVELARPVAGIYEVLVATDDVRDSATLRKRMEDLKVSFTMTIRQRSIPRNQIAGIINLRQSLA